jgi:hypothetical protein
MSNHILPFVDSSSFDADATAAMGLAFDRIAAGLHDKGQPALVLEAIAKRIVELATAGERDADRMCEQVLLGGPGGTS